MKVAKEFRWEAAHRLPWHRGGCQNVHGHSYRMTIELEGQVDQNGMVLDFKEIKEVLKPIVDEWDHSTLVAEYDLPLLDAMRTLGSKHCVLPYDTTSENMCVYVFERLRSSGADRLATLGIENVRVRIRETETCYAEITMPLLENSASGDGASTELAELG